MSITGNVASAPAPTNAPAAQEPSPPRDSTPTTYDHFNNNMVANAVLPQTVLEAYNPYTVAAEPVNQHQYQQTYNPLPASYIHQQNVATAPAPAHIFDTNGAYNMAAVAEASMVRRHSIAYAPDMSNGNTAVPYYTPSADFNPYYYAQSTQTYVSTDMSVPGPSSAAPVPQQGYQFP